MPRRRNPFPTPRQHKGAAVVDVYNGTTRHTLYLTRLFASLPLREFDIKCLKAAVGRSSTMVEFGIRPTCSSRRTK